MRACASQPDVVVTAACDVWDSRRDAVVQQFKDTCKGYRDFREMLRAEGPRRRDHRYSAALARAAAITACEAGKDIYFQKPMTRYLAESFAVRNAVRKHNPICQIGTQIHASENYRRVVEFIRSGNLGPVAAVRTFNVMNQGPQGVGLSPAAQPHLPDLIGTSGAAPRPSAPSIPTSSPMAIITTRGWLSAAAGRRAWPRTSLTCRSGP